MPPRRRLPPDHRRHALLDVGEEVFRESSIDDVSMQQIADRAGVTRALLYHYFATKAELFGGVWARAHERLRTGASPLKSQSPPVTVRDWAEVRLRVYLDFYVANLPLVVIANRSSIASDPAVRRPIDASFTELSSTLIDAAGTQLDSRAAAEVGFVGWVAFVRETSLATYLDARITPSENIDLCMAAFDAALGRYLDLDAPAP
ncbi:TetR/AcrR family transcriptional regulator [Gordonia liuliyuniae]|uniref:TetR/AcrR family transcriptional regulator n=1 Tax=Gordonia liuliyuniae TaxID=2911517 RepID=A0ABS9IRY8_9ACTN|nr:TetR/AcrR family transcriptional regulator [Gordonia liuliyuniae]MCF8588322.1 TetR/AcrR family transcriptional regulator [Gordonia liuliyuniae]